FSDALAPRRAVKARSATLVEVKEDNTKCISSHPKLSASTKCLTSSQLAGLTPYLTPFYNSRNLNYSDLADCP
ncbi:MAG: hypothetical protein IKP36_12030, partial [Bacteroidaceae bacterium]|nr:hypothetical protein [Bacteroidaceae bacterium]